MSNRRRDESGRFADEVTDQEILKLFDKDNEAFLTAPEIADRFGVSRQAVNNRLKRMEEDGLVESKKAGASAVGWWATVAPRLSEEAQARADAADRAGAVPLDDLEAEFEADGSA